MRWEVHVACTEKRTVACRVMVGKHKGKRSLGIQWLGLDNNIQMDLSRTGMKA